MATVQRQLPGLIICLVVACLVGCASPAAPGSSAAVPLQTPQAINLAGDAAAQATIQQREAEDAAATLESIASQATATADMATRIVLAATAQTQATRDSIATTEAQLQATIISQNTRAAATATSIAQATSDSLYVQATEIALKKLTLAVNSTATADAQKAINDQMLAQDHQIFLANQRQRESWWNSIGIPAIVFTAITLALLTGVVAATWVFKRVTYQPIRQVRENGRDVTIVTMPNGQYAVVPPPKLDDPYQQPALPPPNGTTIPSSPVSDMLPANWQAFMQWDNPLYVPIGADYQSGEPILINRIQEPHLLITGTTGSAKTTGGLLPFTTAMIGTGLHAIMVNGRGSDFLPFKGHSNVTILPKVPRAERPIQLIHLLNALVTEIDQRDAVLERYAAANWSDLPQHAGQPGELVVVIDEFLAIIESVRDMDKHAANSMWRSLIAVSSEARKFGIYLALTATDPTHRALGAKGLTVRDQMARMAFGMKNADASRKIIGAARQPDFPNGSVGLPRGQFISTIMGQIKHGVAFYPSHEEIQLYLSQRQVPVNLLPDTLLQAIQRSEPVLAAPAASSYYAAPPVYAPIEGRQQHSMGQAAADGRALDKVIGQMTSLRAVGSYLYGRASISGQDIQNRVKPALQWRWHELGCERSRLILSRTKS